MRQQCQPLSTVPPNEGMEDSNVRVTHTAVKSKNVALVAGAEQRRSIQDQAKVSKL